LLTITILIIYKHRQNIRRLIDGKEPKISLKHHQLTDLTESVLKEESNEQDRK
jgi:hypothetical protein